MRHDPNETQQRVLKAIHAHIQAAQFPPTIRELCAAVGLNSSSMMRVTLTQLEMRGMIEIARADNGIMLARGLRLTPKGRAAQTHPAKELL